MVDGKTDVFMWRNSTHTWTINLSTGNGLCTKGVDWRMGVRWTNSYWRPEW